MNLARVDRFCVGTGACGAKGTVSRNTRWSRRKPSNEWQWWGYPAQRAETVLERAAVDGIFAGLVIVEAIGILGCRNRARDAHVVVKVF